MHLYLQQFQFYLLTVSEIILDLKLMRIFQQHLYVIVTSKESKESTYNKVDINKGHCS